MRSVLITCEMPDMFMEGLLKQGFLPAYRPHIERSELEPHLRQALGLVISTRLTIDVELLSMAPELKFIARAGSGMENIDVEAATTSGIACINSPEGNCDAVAEHAIGMLLALRHHILRSDHEIRLGQWQRERNRGEELMGSTVGIFGFGHTGRAFARKLQGFDVRVLAFDPYVTDFDTTVAEKASREQIFAHAEILSLHLPLSKETHNMVNLAFLEQFQHPIWLLNTSRGAVLQTEDLITALDAGLVKGAGLDVYKTEPIHAAADEEHVRRLMMDHRVIMTPHVAGWSLESRIRIAEVLLQKLNELDLRASDA